jgi:hypothetical protein
LLEGKKLFYTGLDGIYLPMQLTDWPLVEVALLLNHWSYQNLFCQKLNLTVWEEINGLLNY